MKPCVKCGNTDRNSKGDCKVCASIRAETYYEKNKEIRKQKAREYYANNKERQQTAQANWRAKNKKKKQASDKAYRDANPERMAAHKRKYYDNNTDLAKQRARDWRLNNLDKAKEYAAQYHKKKPEAAVNAKAKRRERIGSDKLPYGTIPTLYARQNGKCACCGVELNGKYHVDHIMPLALGGRNIPENIQLLTQRCNHRKSAKHPDVWKAELTASLPEGVSSFSVCKP